MGKIKVYCCCDDLGNTILFIQLVNHYNQFEFHTMPCKSLVHKFQQQQRIVNMKLN